VQRPLEHVIGLGIFNGFGGVHDQHLMRDLVALPYDTSLYLVYVTYHDVEASSFATRSPAVAHRLTLKAPLVASRTTPSVANLASNRPKSSFHERLNNYSVLI
jgi:hypothetical protein